MLGTHVHRFKITDVNSRSLFSVTVILGDSLVHRIQEFWQRGLHAIPVGTFVYNVEIKPGTGAKLGRSAGTHIEVVAQDAKHTTLKMPSSELRKVPRAGWASVGSVSNEEHRLVSIGKAGRARHMGLRPKTRGTAKNAVDHPHGGGEGRSPRGHRRSRTKQGRPTGKGQKTRSPKKYSNKLIVARRKPGKLMRSGK